MRIKCRTIPALLLAGLSLAGCDIFSSRHTYRYRLAVDVQTPQGLRTGSSVIEVSASESDGINGRQVHSELSGEAVAIDMPDGTTLFALLKSVDGLNAPYASAAYARILPESIKKNADWRIPHDAIARQTSIAEVPKANFPIFVRFTNIKNPRSVVLVDPFNLEKDYEYGTKIYRVTVVITDKPITKRIEKIIPWIGSVATLSDDNSMYRDAMHPERNLRRRDFKQG